MWDTPIGLAAESVIRKGYRRHATLAIVEGAEGLDAGGRRYSGRRREVHRRDGASISTLRKEELANQTLIRFGFAGLSGLFLDDIGV